MGTRHTLIRRSPRRQNRGDSSFLKLKGRAFNKGGMVLPLLLCASIFSKESLGINVYGSRVDLLQCALVFYGLLQIGRAEIAPKVGAFLIVLLSTSFLLLSFFEYDTKIFLKQGIPAVLIFTGTCSALERVSSRNLITAYKQVCFYVALFGLVQILLDLGGVSLLIKTSGRLDSFSEEPSYFAIAIGPAVYLLLREKVKNRNLWFLRAGVIISAFLLTISVTALITLIVIVLLIGASTRGPIYAFAILSLLFSLYVNQDSMPIVIQQKLRALSDSRAEEVGSGKITNLSVLSPVSNWEVAKNTLIEGRLLGNGFGGHLPAYDDYFKNTEFSFSDRYKTNAIGGHSLFIRSASEFGLLGIFMYVILILRGFFNASKDIQIWTTLLAIVLVGRVIKLGGYFELGFPIFILAPLVFYSRPIGNRIPIRKKRRSLLGRDKLEVGKNVKRTEF